MAEDVSFKVTDRRGREQERERRGRRQARPRPPRRTERRATRSAPAESPVPRRPEPSPRRVPVDLQGLFVMFASSALVALGEAADPATGERLVDLDQARMPSISCSCCATRPTGIGRSTRVDYWRRCSTTSSFATSGYARESLDLAPVSYPITGRDRELTLPDPDLVHHARAPASGATRRRTVP